MSAIASTSAELISSAPVARPRLRVVVIGSGPAGLRLARELADKRLSLSVILCGDEPHAPYDRVRLSSYLAGELGSIVEPLVSSFAGTVQQRLGRRIVQLDRANRCVVDAVGERLSYDRLVIATGSRPRIPRIAGLDLPGVFTFRDLNDAAALAARRLRTRHTVVVGGGLLGLETARAMRRFNTHITVVEHTPRLMFNQLDDGAAALLEQGVKAQGIDVLAGCSVREVTGGNRVETVCLNDGRILACDTVVLAAGIQPNIELARDAGLRVGRGIVVDDQLRTSDPIIHAIGECAQHQGQVYGLAAPGFEQASVAAGVIAGERVHYRGSSQATRLKVVSVPVFSAGDVIDSARPVETLVHTDGERYRMLNIDRGRLVGACAVGAWNDNARLEEQVRRGGLVWPWQRWHFRRHGSLWSAEDAASAASWPATAVICNCTGVTRGDITAAIRAGAISAETLAESTRASTVCGSCRPLLQQIVGADEQTAATGGWRTLGLVSALVAVVMLAYAVLPGAPYAKTVQTAWNWNLLWYHTAFKEWSGYALLAIGGFAALLSLRKRLPEVTWLDYSSWRVVHVLTGVVLVALLCVHTGFRAGANLNAWLMACFALALASGAAIGGVLAFEHRLAPGLARNLRSASLWTHLALLWPLPVLVIFHVVKTYYF